MGIVWLVSTVNDYSSCSVGTPFYWLITFFFFFFFPFSHRENTSWKCQNIPTFIRRTGKFQFWVLQPSPTPWVLTFAHVTWHSANNTTTRQSYQINWPYTNTLWQSCTSRFCSKNNWQRGIVFLRCFLLPPFSILGSNVQFLIVIYQITGPALVFDGEESMITAISENPANFKVMRD